MQIQIYWQFFRLYDGGPLTAIFEGIYMLKMKNEAIIT